MIFAHGTLNVNEFVLYTPFAFQYKNTFRLTQFASRTETPVLTTATSGHTHERDREHLPGAVQKSGETQMLLHYPPEPTPQLLQVTAENAVRLQHSWVDPTAGSCRPLAVKVSL